MLQLKNIVKYYTSDASVTMALKNINLEFKKGEFVAITGKSGSGKSTLMNIISGMDTYEEGELYYCGQETSYYDAKDWEAYRKEKISFIYQSYQLIDSYTALENVEAVMSICGGEESAKQRKKRRRKAYEILDKVGLKKWARHKAVHLSSGQKQRLGIARALAKETDIIIADEPTGNLDVENGKAVMKILYELSKEKLVLVVTHNYEQVEEYASRKIRLFDGEVAEDTILRAPSCMEDSEKESEKQKEKTAKKARNPKLLEWKKAIHFARLNRRAQPHRSFFIAFIMAFSIAAFYIMYGYFLGNLDQTKVRTKNETAFHNTREDRLVVRKMDGGIFTNEEKEELEKLKYVKAVNFYDYASEISCLFEPNEDYKIEYKKTEESQRKSMSVTALSYEHYLGNADGLQEEELLCGTVAKAADEVVLPSNDKSLVGQTLDLYFVSQSWAGNVYLSGTFKVTGLIAPEDMGVYLTGEYLDLININYADTELQMEYSISRIYEDKDIEAKQRKQKVILVKGKNLEGKQIRVANALTMNLSDTDTLKEELIPTAILRESEQEDVFTEVEVVEERHSGSMTVAEVSQECLESFYGSTEITQISVLMDDYAYTDRVIREINDLGYEVISPFRMCAGEFDAEKVENQMFTILMSVGTIVVIFFISVLVIYAMLKLRRKDFEILKSLGMSQSIIQKMNWYELLTDSIVITVFFNLFAIFAGRWELSQIAELVKYYQSTDYLFMSVLAVCLSIVIAEIFNRYIKKIMGR